MTPPELRSPLLLTLERLFPDLPEATQLAIVRLARMSEKRFSGEVLISLEGGGTRTFTPSPRLRPADLHEMESLDALRESSLGYVRNGQTRVDRVATSEAK